MKVEKRDGRLVSFDIDRIRSAITKAANHSSSKLSDYEITALTARVAERIDGEDVVTVEHIQDMVVSILRERQPHIAKVYSEYRDERTRIRDVKSTINRMIHDLVEVDSADSDLKRENANINADTAMGSMLKIGSETSKKYYLDNLVNPEFTKKHNAGLYHIHDSDFADLTINCEFVPLGKLLEKGFNTGQGSIRPPKTLRTAANLSCIILQSSQNDFFGGQAFASYDFTLGKYVALSYVKHVYDTLEIASQFAKDKMPNEAVRKFRYELNTEAVKHVNKYGRIMDTPGNLLLDTSLSALGFEDSAAKQKILDIAKQKTEDEVAQAMEAVVHNLCTMASRAGSQVPFSSLNYGLDTSVEGRMITDKLLTAIDNGLGHGETAIFPISIFKLKKGITDEGSPNHDLFLKACKVSAKRLYPNFISLDAPFNLKYYKEDDPRTHAATMGMTASGSVKLRLFRQGETIDQTMDIRNVKLWLQKEGVITDDMWQRAMCGTDYVRFPDTTLAIFDSTQHAYVTVKTFMMANDAEAQWLDVTTARETLTLTSDHPLCVGRPYAEGQSLLPADIPVEIDGTTYIFSRVKVMNLKLGDYLYSCDGNHQKVIGMHLKDNMLLTGYDFETTSDRFDLSTIVSHNCRTRVIGNKHNHDFEITEGRGNLFVLTLSLPYLALSVKAEHQGDTPLVEAFFNALGEEIHHCINQLDERFEMICRRKAKNFPFSMGQGSYLDSDDLGYDDSIRKAILNGTRTIGFIGLAECLVALIGKHHGESAEAQELGLRIVKFMHDEIEEIGNTTGINYSLMGSPAEGCSGRLAKLLRKNFGVVPGVSDKDYLTNSHHVPVSYNISVWDKIDIEAPYHQYEPAGGISYAEVDIDTTTNVEAFVELVEYMADSGMGYFSINHPVARDPVCGYIGHIPEGGACPRCGRREGEGVSAQTLLKVQTRETSDVKYALNAAMIEH